MLTTTQRQQYYQALLGKNSDFDGVFYVGVTTTGIFCRPTCPARKPKFEHCEFFETAEQALLASFRPCLRCKPLSHPNQTSELVQALVNAVEAHPEKRWKDSDFRALAIDASTARRQFKKRFGMTFVQYARARRMGIAMKHIREGHRVIDTQLASGYESDSGFRDAFSRIMGAPPSRASKNAVLKAAWLDTRLGAMIAIADEHALYLLEFVDRRGLEREVERLRIKTRSAIIPGRTPPIDQIENELKRYFNGGLSSFTTPVKFLGTPFQQHVWQTLLTIPYGETRAYLHVAESINHRDAVRAVAGANGANQLAIIIPCHRVINNNGGLGGYGGGIGRKQWLLQHEEKHRRLL